MAQIILYYKILKVLKPTLSRFKLSITNKIKSSFNLIQKHQQSFIQKTVFFKSINVIVIVIIIVIIVMLLKTF